MQNCSVKINKFWQFAAVWIWVSHTVILSKLLDFIESLMLLDVTTFTLNYFFSWKLRIDFFLILNNLGLQFSAVTQILQLSAFAAKNSDFVYSFQTIITNLYRKYDHENITLAIVYHIKLSIANLL